MNATAYSQGSISPVFWVLWLLLIVVYIAAFWRIFSKAGKPGWAAIIPIYNWVVLLQISGKPVWWFILFFIPVVNIVITLLVAIDLAKAFGKSALFGVLLLWLFSFIGYLVLGFGGAKYVGASAASPQAPQTPTQPAQPVPAQAQQVQQPPTTVS